MKKVIGTVLFILWTLLACLLVVEPNTDIPNQPYGDWVGWVYLGLLFGLPVIWSKLLSDNR